MSTTVSVIVSRRVGEMFSGPQWMPAPTSMNSVVS